MSTRSSSWIERAWKPSGGAEVRLLLKASGTTLDQFVDALDQVNDRHVRRHSPRLAPGQSTSTR